VRLVDKATKQEEWSLTMEDPARRFGLDSEPGMCGQKSSLSVVTCISHVGQINFSTVTVKWPFQPQQHMQCCVQALSQTGWITLDKSLHLSGSRISPSVKREVDWRIWRDPCGSGIPVSHPNILCLSPMHTGPGAF
jgi:hypothetical protein